MKYTNNWIKKTVIVLALALGLAVPAFNNTPVSASLFSGAKGEACVAVDAADKNTGQCDQKELEKGQDNLSTTLTTLLNLVTMIVGIMSVIMIIISGIRFVTAGGDSNNIASAKNTFIYALVGLVIVAFAQIIVKLVLTRIS